MRWHIVLFTAFLILATGALAQQEQISLYSGGTYSPDTPAQISYYVPSVKPLPFALYRVRNPEALLESGGPQDFDTSGLELKRLRSLTVHPKKQQGSQSGYGEVDLGKLPVGIYFAQIGTGKTAGATLLLVTDLGLVVKSDQNTVLAYTADLDAGVPRKARVYLLNDKGIKAKGLADGRGLTAFSVSEPNGSDQGANSGPQVAAKYGDAWAFSNATWNSWAVSAAEVYIVTDRPIYRPGQTVDFKVTARAPGSLQPLTGQKVSVKVTDSQNNTIFQRSYTADAYGSVHGQVQLGVAPPLGYYEIDVTVAGEEQYLSFEVQEYQKPEYSVSVTPAQKTAIQGDTVQFTVKAEYLFGGAVAGADVSYALLEQPYHRYQYQSSYGFYQTGGYSYGGKLVKRGEGVLNAEGELVVTYTLPEDAQDYQLTLQAGVTDVARREISASGSLIAYRANLVLGIDTDTYAYKAGDTAKVTVQAQDLPGNPVSTSFTVTRTRYVWVKGTGRVASGSQSYQSQTDAQGKAMLSVPLDKEGSYELTVRAKDTQGRETSADTFLWVSGDVYWYWGYNDLKITPDKPEYKPGDTAHFVIESPVPDAYALITREGKSLASYQLVKFKGSVYTYDLPITADMAPNGYLSVTIIAGGQMYQQTAGFKVPPVGKFLHVEITSDSDTYKPGSEGTFRLRVSDADGQGVKAQLTLALVDEGIFLIRPDNTEDIRGFFYGLRDNVVGTDLSAWYYFGQAKPLAKGRAPLGAAVFAQSKSSLAAAKVRQNFKDTALWLPDVQTDADGEATVHVTFPDNLTTWRLTARAITKGDEAGQNTYKVKTTLPVIARLAAPNFLVHGDTTSLRVIGQSNLKTAQQGQLTLEAEGLNLTNPAPRDVTLPAGGTATADFTAQAEQTGSASLTASALTPVASDALKRPLSVLPRGIRDEVTWAGSNSDSWSFTLPAQTDLSSLQATLYLTPSLAAAVAPALSYLAGYPYGCTEQTMSRFLPSVLAARAGDLAHLPEDIAKNLDGMVQTGLRRLYDFQHDDGGWGFWKYDASNPFITAYVVSGLLEARAAGYRVDSGVLEDGVKYLEQTVTPPAPPDRGGGEAGGVNSEAFTGVVKADAEAYAYYALAKAGKPTPGLEELLANKRLTPYGLALGVLTLAQQNKTTEANLYLDQLLYQAKVGRSVAYWQATAPKYFWNDDSVEATAYGLEALAELRPHDPLLPKVVHWLLLERQGNRWISTKETAAVVQAALVLAKQTGESAGSYQVAVSVNGKVLMMRDIHPTGIPSGQNQANQGLTLPLSGLKPGSNDLEVTVKGSGTLFESASVSYVSEGALKPEDNGLSVTRTYQALKLVYDKKNQRYLYQPTPLTSSSVGDYVLVTVTLNSEGHDRFVMVNEPIPAGYRVVENDQVFRIAGVKPPHGYDYFGWNYWYDGREIHDSYAAYYFTALVKPVTFTYILRAETPGSYTALPTQAWLMYQPEVRGVGAARELEVKPGSAQ